MLSMRKRLPKRLISRKNETLRPISKGAERWLNRPIRCLDHGFVYLVDYSGNDDAVVEAARVSYGRGTRKINEDRGLIRYLMRHFHTTPFEMIEFKFHARMPIFVARQWIRHRTASVNEYSGRYSIINDEFYLPDVSVLAKQSKTNRQGRGESLSIEQKARILEILKEDHVRTYGHYKEFLDLNLARELARIGLSVASYTEWYWKIDLHNLLHFLKLRLDRHAQYEIRVYAEAMARIVKDAVPITYEAFDDYRLNAMTLSKLEILLIKTKRHSFPMQKALAEDIFFQEYQNRGEAREFAEKLEKLNMILPWE